VNVQLVGFWGFKDTPAFGRLLVTHTMSTVSTPSDSPASLHIQPLHNPQNAAHVTIPQAFRSSATTNGAMNHGPGMGARAFLAKRMTKAQ
jgi:hypothetical protein